MSKSSISDRLLWIVEMESINEFWAARKYFWNPKYFPVFYFDASSYVVLYNQNLTRFPIPTYYIKNKSCWSKNTSTEFLYIFVRVKVWKMTWDLRRLLQTTRNRIGYLKFPEVGQYSHSVPCFLAMIKVGDAHSESESCRSTPSETSRSSSFFSVASCMCVTGYSLECTGVSSPFFSSKWTGSVLKSPSVPSNSVSYRCNSDRRASCSTSSRWDDYIRQTWSYLDQPFRT